MQFLVQGTDEKGAGVEVRLEAADAGEASAKAAGMGIRVLSLVAQSAGGESATAVPLVPVVGGAVPGVATGGSVAPAALNYSSWSDAPIWLIQRRWVWILGLLATEGFAVFCLIARMIYKSISEGASIDTAWQAPAVLVVGMGLMFGIQLALLAPVARPQAGPGPAQPAWQWLSAIALGLLLGMMVLCGMAMLADFVWCLDAGTTVRDAMAWSGLVLAVLSWIVSTPLVVMFMRRRRPESVVAMGAAAIFLGSTLEFVAALPLMALVTRKNDCTCASFTFWSMFLISFTGFLVLGPIILLILFTRRTRAVSRGHCAACGFDMRGLANRDQCPRCGSGWKVTA